MAASAHSTTCSVTLEGTLWIPGTEWTRAIEHVAARFARVRMLDAESINTLPTLREQVEALDVWGGDDIDWHRELTRYLDEHLSLHLKPQPDVRRAVRTLATRSSIDVVTALPTAAATTIIRHLGLARSVATITDASSARQQISSVHDLLELAQR